ncbi:HPr family phosphocarrier protein [candidate division TA06 bacterium]|uniref:HPr family phosphocarrier protein n=1 Tax=candidate division TA06 bacterium TaxID=2250710 RepID=A0A933MKL1_UNCT6|nr:HPr family phosphocarrier protein [candidate division TA06 bacterium]
MQEKAFTIVNRLGMHARPAALFVKTAGKFKSRIWVRKDQVEVNGKSIMGVMMLAAEPGSILAVRAEGEDEALALEALGRLISDKFNED